MADSRAARHPAVKGDTCRVRRPAPEDRAWSPDKTVRGPRVSVVMGVYNGSRYLRQAVESVLSQTFSDLEFVIVNDGSTDDTSEILADWSDPRIVVLENGRNLGLTRSLNRGIRSSAGEFIARQDADDVSMPERLARQVACLEAQPDVGLVGTGSRWIDGQGVWIHDWTPAVRPEEIQRHLLAAIPFLHGTFLFRRDCLEDGYGGYDETKPVAQDCDLVLRISERWDVTNLPEILYIHRRHEATVTAMRGDEQEMHLHLAQQAAIHRRLSYGLGRLGLSRSPLPGWVRTADRRWLAQRYVWWSAAARMLDRRVALQFMLIALAMDPMVPELRSYAREIVAHGVQRATHKADRTIRKGPTGCPRGNGESGSLE